MGGYDNATWSIDVDGLGGLAEFERHLILARTSEGRQRAQARGVKFGRKPKLICISNRRHWRGGQLVKHCAILRSLALNYLTSLVMKWARLEW